jgi:hypothetical protein
MGKGRRGEGRQPSKEGGEGRERERERERERVGRERVGQGTGEKGGERKGPRPLA